MFDIGWTELVVVACVAVLVVGPKDLPGMLRTFGKTVGGLRRMAGDFQRQFNDALKEAELDDVQKAAAFKPLDEARKSAQAFQNSLKAPIVEDDAAPDAPAAATVATDDKPAETASVKKSAAKTSTASAGANGAAGAPPVKTPVVKASAARTQAAKKPAAQKASPKPAAPKPAASGRAAAKPAGAGEAKPARTRPAGGKAARSNGAAR